MIIPIIIIPCEKLHWEICEVVSLTRLGPPRYLAAFLFLGCLHATTNTVKALRLGRPSDVRVRIQNNREQGG